MLSIIRFDNAVKVRGTEVAFRSDRRTKVIVIP